MSRGQASMFPETERVGDLLDRPLWCLDYETTGVDPTNCRPVTCALVELAPDGEAISSHRWLINAGVEIPPEAAAVHGYTTDAIQKLGQDPAEACGELLELLENIDHPVVIYNARFDWRLLGHEARRHHLGRPTRFLFDPFVIDRAVDPYRKGRRTLESVAQHYGVSLTGAHEASADAIAAGRVFRELVRRNLLPRDHTLPAAQHWQRTAYLRWRNNYVTWCRANSKPIDQDLTTSEWPERNGE